VYILNEQQLLDNNFPRWNEVDNCVAPFKLEGKRALIADDGVCRRAGNNTFSRTDLRRECARCTKEYYLTIDGEYARVNDDCVYHPQRAYKRRVGMLPLRVFVIIL
jgi:hypothetical protein